MRENDRPAATRRPNVGISSRCCQIRYDRPVDYGRSIDQNPDAATMLKAGPRRVEVLRTPRGVVFVFLKR